MLSGQTPNSGRTISMAVARPDWMPAPTASVRKISNGVQHNSPKVSAVPDSGNVQRDQSTKGTLADVFVSETKKRAGQSQPVDNSRPNPKSSYGSDISWMSTTPVDNTGEKSSVYSEDSSIQRPPSHNHWEESTNGAASKSSNGLVEFGSPHGRTYDRESIKARIIARVKDYYGYVLGTGPGTKAGTSIQYLCAFHEDKHASLTVSSAHGGFKCHGCGKSGDVFSVWMLRRGVDFKATLQQLSEWLGDPAFAPKQSAKAAQIDGGTTRVLAKKTYAAVEKASKTLLSEQRVLDRLLERYGIKRETAKKYNLGWHRKECRLWIPIYHKGRLVNVRKHDIMRIHCVWDQGGKVHKDLPAGANEADWNTIYDRKTCRAFNRLGGKVIGLTGHNSVTLYPSESLGLYSAESKKPMCITGGELKAIFLNQEGIPAVAFTGGEGTYVKSWLPKFNGMNLEIALDADPAGVKGANRIGEAIKKYCPTVAIVSLPFGDVNDYYRARQWDFSDWKQLPRHVVREVIEESALDIPFGALRDSDYYDKQVQFRAVLAGSGDTPYFVQEKIKAKCNKGQSLPVPLCKTCPLPTCGFEGEWEINPESVVNILRHSPKKQKKFLKETVAGIPKNCHWPELSYEPRRVQNVGLVEDLDSIRDNPDEESRMGKYFVHQAYYVGEENVNENEPHKCFGKVVADPYDSTATIILQKMTPLRKSFESAELSPESTKALSGFPGGNNSLGTVFERLGFYTYEIGDIVAQIYDQKQLVLGQMLVWFMPLRFKLYEKWNEKIGAEALFIGDTRAGKTSTAKTLLRHFRAGRFISCEGATYAGLVGGADSVGTKKFFTWGALPTQDQGIVVLDEIDDIVESGVFSKLTSIRSDGVATRTIAGGMRQCSAQLRMTMMTNPVGTNRKMKSYSSTMFAINELIKHAQDVARFEFAIGVYGDDDPDKYNIVPSKEKPLYTSEIASEHIRWAWKQKPHIQGDVAQEVLDASTRLAKRFVGLNLLPPSESRWKVARVACAIAALCFSRDKHGNVNVTKYHVQASERWFQGLYGGDKFAYDKFIGRGIEKNKDVIELLKRLGKNKVEYLYYNDSFSKEMLEGVIMSVVSWSEFFRILHIENPCLVMKRNKYFKGQAFKELLGELR